MTNMQNFSAVKCCPRTGRIAVVANVIAAGVVSLLATMSSMIAMAGDSTYVSSHSQCHENELSALEPAPDASVAGCRPIRAGRHTSQSSTTVSGISMA